MQERQMSLTYGEIIALQGFSVALILFAVLGCPPALTHHADDLWIIGAVIWSIAPIPFVTYGM